MERSLDVSVVFADPFNDGPTTVLRASEITREGTREELASLTQLEVDGSHYDVKGLAMAFPLDPARAMIRLWVG
ncbi:MAG: hypothetical protein AAGG01_22050 [Planctomycetota bacterium]